MNPPHSAPSTSERTLVDHDSDFLSQDDGAPRAESSTNGRSDFEQAPFPTPAPPPLDLQKTVIVEEGLPTQTYAPDDAPPTAEPPGPTAEADAPAIGFVGPPAPAPPPAKPAISPAALRRRQRRRRERMKRLLPAWSVSLVVHLVIFTVLGAATLSEVTDVKPININTALGGLDRGLEETPIFADPTDRRLDQIGETRDRLTPSDDETWADERPNQGSMIAAVAAPSATPSIRGVVARASDAESRLGPSAGLADLKRSSINHLPAALSTDLYGGGNFGGDPTFDVGGIGDALNQLTHEILNHLAEHQVTVVWLLDESASMRDDHRTIAEKFDRVSSELNRFVPADKRASGALNHVLVSFGEKVSFPIDKPTTDADEIRRSMTKLRIDDTGIENTMRAIREAVGAFSRLVSKDRKLLMVLATDESGDDGAEIEEALAALKKYNIPLYVIGRQSVFGYPYAHHRYVDPITKDVYHPTIRRGPETADVEIFQWDGLYARWDEKPSGFAPWELARLTKESGGIYFLLPTEEFLRLRKAEKTYSIEGLKEFMPEYLGRAAYIQRRTESDLRRNLHQIVVETQGSDFRYRREFPVKADDQAQAAREEGLKATQRLNALVEIQKRLEKIKKHRDREPLRRWRAHYDLMLAQVVVFQIKAYEYRALMAQLAQKPKKPSKAPTPNLAITFVVDHASKGLAPDAETAKKYSEANHLLNNVIAEYPDTPWADLAKDALTRGFSVVLNQWEHSPNYKDRQRFVPKY